MAADEESIEQPWCCTGNIVDFRPFGPGGAEFRAGTKHFRGGTKVHIVGWYPGMVQSIVVVGHHRASHRWVMMTVPARRVTNLRPQLIYSPTVIRLIGDRPDDCRPGFSFTKEFATRLVTALVYWE